MLGRGSLTTIGPPGAILGGLGAVLGGSWGVTVRSWGGLGSTLRYIMCKSCVSMCAGTAERCVCVRVRASWRDLGPTWVDLGSFWGGPRGAFLLIFYWFLHYFVEIDVFDVKPVPRRFGDEIWSKMTPSWAPKTTQNRSKIETEH